MDRQDNDLWRIYEQCGCSFGSLLSGLQTRQEIRSEWPRIETEGSLILLEALLQPVELPWWADDDFYYNQ